MISITIDCEQWNSPLLRGKIVKENDNTEFSRKGNLALLPLLDRYNVKSTFFITGFFAEKEKAQVKEIFKTHEIGCHGYNHFYRGNKNLNLKEDIKKAKIILEGIVNKKIVGFRAPQMQYSIELIKILKEIGFEYDSSLHPANMPGFYNNSKYPIVPFFPLKNNFIEIPAAVTPNLRLPISWVFMRNLGYKWTLRAIKRLEKLNLPVVLYFHSWEFTQINSKNVPYYYRRNTGERFLKTLEKLIKNLKDFSTLSEIAENERDKQKNRI